VPPQLIEVELGIPQLLSTYADNGLSRRKNLTMIMVQEAKDDKANLTADLEEFDFTLEVSLRNRILSKASVPEPLDAGLVERVIAGRQSQCANRCCCIETNERQPVGFKRAMGLNGNVPVV